jgi:hypothetical protein
MNKLSKEQRDQLIGIAIGTVGLMAALWWFGVKSIQHDLIVTKDKTTEMQKKLHDAETLMRSGGEIGETLTNRSDLLAKREAGLAPDRDAYAWLIKTINDFITTRKGVSIDSFSQAEIGDVGMIPKFPYRWATFHLKGSGYYHDLGKFFADFENNFPYFRIQNPILSVNVGPAMEAEKLSVSFDLVAPVIASSPDIK